MPQKQSKLKELLQKQVLCSNIVDQYVGSVLEGLKKYFLDCVVQQKKDKKNWWYIHNTSEHQNYSVHVNYDQFDHDTSVKLELHSNCYNNDVIESNVFSLDSSSSAEKILDWARENIRLHNTKIEDLYGLNKRILVPLFVSLCRSHGESLFENDLQVYPDNIFYKNTWSANLISCLTRKGLSKIGGSGCYVVQFKDNHITVSLNMSATRFSNTVIVDQRSFDVDSTFKDHLWLRSQIVAWIEDWEHRLKQGYDLSAVIESHKKNVDSSSKTC